MTPTTTASRAPFVPDDAYNLHIGGREVAPHDRFEAVDPSTGVPWTELPQASGAQVDDAVRAAAGAFSAWRRSSPATRQELLWRIAERIERDPERWARLLATENGRPIREARFADVPAAAGIFRYFSGLSRDHRGAQVPVEDPDTQIYTVREPLGVIAAVIPWNSPLITLANKVAPALAAGNAIVLKPSEYASASVLEFARQVADLVPPGLIDVVTGFGPEVGAALVAHPGVAKVTFTGGGATARHVLRAAGERLTPGLMELGGKGPMIVCADADLDLAVADALTGIFLASGQSCIASSRVLVDARVHEDFAQRFLDVARRITLGDALDDATQLGPMACEPQYRRVLAALERARQDGVPARLGGGVPDVAEPLRGGFYVEPTVLDDPAGTSTASREEIFGPVLALQSFEREEEAVTRANATEYGLAAGVWTRDLARAHRIARDLDAGIVWVNKWFDLPFGAPMGGVKQSGFGRELCAETMLEYSAPKTVNIGLGAERPPLWT